MSVGNWTWITRRSVWRGRRGTCCRWHWAPLVARGAAPLCVAGVALRDIHLRFTWQAQHLETSTCVWRGRRGTSSPFVARGTSWHWHFISVAGVALRDTDAPFAMFATLRGRRGTWWHWRAICVPGVALCDIDISFAWQALHFVTSTFVSRGRRSTWRHLPAFGVAGVALRDIHLLLIALRDIDISFPWQAWHFVTLTFHLQCLRLCVAGVALGDIDVPFAWQALHFVTLTLTFHLRCLRVIGHILLVAHCVWLYVYGVVALAQSGKRPCDIWQILGGSDAGLFLHMLLARHVYLGACLSHCRQVPPCGRRLCACLIETFWKQCWHVFSLWPNVARGLVHVWSKLSGSNAGTFTFWKKCWHVFLACSDSASLDSGQSKTLRFDFRISAPFKTQLNFPHVVYENVSIPLLDNQRRIKEY